MRHGLRAYALAMAAVAGLGLAVAPSATYASLSWSIGGIATAGAILAAPVAVLATHAAHHTLDVVPLALIGSVTVILVVVRINSVLRHVEDMRARAAKSEQRFRMVFDSAGQGISIGSNGMMTETNETLQHMLGYTSAELERMHYTETTYPDDRQLAEDDSEDALSGRRASHTFEKRLLRKDGSSFWASVTLSRARDGSFGISLIHDITVRKLLEEELRQAQKMEAIGKLAGGIAHDFNNLMTAVSACSDVLLGEIDESDPRHERVEVISQSAARATELTRQFLAFSRRQVLRFEPVDLAQLVRGVEGILARLLPPNIVVEYELERDAIVRIDRRQFEQVLLNLALNARDAMPGGGRLVISVRTPDNGVELVVGDDGIGMSEETAARIFEPFFTTKAAGTGLGLSTVDGIIAQSSGTVTVTSQPALGSVFTIRLPRVVAVVPGSEPPAEEPAPPAPGRVLLADDEDLVRRVTGDMLKRLGYEVIAAASGEQALELLDDTVDCIVTDVAMTGMNGRTLAERAWERLPQLPVLFVSGYPAEVLSGNRMVREDDEVLTKPFTAAELAERIELVRRRSVKLAAA